MDKVCSKCGVEKDGETGFHWNVLKKKKRAAACKECVRQRNSLTAQARKAYFAKRYIENREAIIKSSVERGKRPDVKAKVSAYQKKRYAENPGKFKAIHSAYRLNNLGKYCALAIKRYAAQMKAVPVWADKFLIEECYHLASVRTKITGFRWNVDHMVPLQSKIVCGLHVQENLTVIPARENIIKGNRQWPNMP